MKYEKKLNGFIEKYLNDTFFDSLRQDYPEFDKWYLKSINDQNKFSYYWTENNKLIAFFGLKIEDEIIELERKNLRKEKRLKITTIKSNKKISKFSEIVFYQAFKIAREKNISKIYFTISLNTKNKEDDKNKLVSIAKDFNFKVIKKDNSNQNKNEILLLKDLRKKSNNWKESYPLLTLKKDIRKYKILIIDDNYHDNYLQDANLYKTNQKNDFTKMAIQKAYVHKQKSISNLKYGDVVLTYRKSTGQSQKKYKSVITGYGMIIDQYKKNFNYKNFLEFKKIVKNIHAFETDDELKKIYDDKWYITLFVWIRAFGASQNINYNWLYNQGIMKKNIYPSDIDINENNFLKILRKGGINV